MSLNGENIKIESAVASRKQAAAELRKARKAARDPRNRLLSDSSDEVPKGILKNSRIPTKRSVSECVDDLSQIMADLDLNIHDLPKATGKFCPHHNYFDEEDEEEEDDNESSGNRRDSTDCEHGEEDADEYNDGPNSSTSSSNNNNNNNNNEKFKSKCDCNNKYGDREDNEKPKKSVRFDEHVYETVFFASRLYDRRYFAKYHFSTRHHPPPNHKSKKNRQRSKSESSKDDHGNLNDNSNGGCKLTKSQRARQSKKDKKKRLMKKDDVTDTSSDDQGYCSSFPSISD